MIRILSLVLTGWVVGLQMAIGYMAAPILFSQLDPIEAGALAGSMLTWAEVAGLIVIAAVSFVPQRPLLRGLLVLSMGAQFLQLAWLNPKMAALKAVGLTQPDIQAQFMQWHGVSQALYLAGLVMLLIWIALGLRELSTDKQGL